MSPTETLQKLTSLYVLVSSVEDAFRQDANLFKDLPGFATLNKGLINVNRGLIEMG